VEAAVANDGEFIFRGFIKGIQNLGVTSKGSLHYQKQAKIQGA
jgi:hypothetical protein